MEGNSVVIGEVLFMLGTLVIRRRDRTVSLTGISTLATLERTGPRRLTDLAASEDVAQPSMTVLVKQLVDQGLAERRRDPTDARVVLVALTPVGHAYLNAQRQAGASALAACVDKLDTHESGTLRDALPALRRLTELVADTTTR